MALETALFQQDQFHYNIHKDLHWSNNTDTSQYHMMIMNNPKNYYLISENDVEQGFKELGVQTGGADPVQPAAGSLLCGRRKRTRGGARRAKSKEEVENQRTNHIAVERNRRKQMNDYLAVLRSIMPRSYVRKGDQASIIGGAINFVKELEHIVQSLEAKKRADIGINNQASPNSVFSNFFNFPQYSSTSLSKNIKPSSAVPDQPQSTAEKRFPAADVEVTMVESHANIKVLMRGRKNQLLKMVFGLQLLGLVVLHLNVTTVDNMVLYSLSVKVEEYCQLTSVNEIAASVYEMVGRIQDEASLLTREY